MTHAVPGPAAGLLPAALRDQVLARVRGGAPLLLTGPPGAGKTTLLHAVAEALEQEGWLPVYLDLMGAASSPEGLVAAALEVLTIEHFGRNLAHATELRRLAAGGKERGAEAVHGLFALWGNLLEASGRPVALLFDEATEIRSLAYFKGLRRAEAPFLQALGQRRHGTLLATGYPTLAARLWPGLEALAVGPLDAADLAAPLAAAGVRVDATAVARASFGWPRYVAALLPSLQEGDAVAAAWIRQMAPGGRLEQLARHTYESLLLRSRGYGMSKAVLAAVAAEEGLNLTALVARLGRTPGAIRDYLGWLLGVDALKMQRKRYYFVDGMLRCWLRLHGRGLAPRQDDIVATAHALVDSGPGPAGAQEPGAVAPAPATLPRRDSLMEID